MLGRIPEAYFLRLAALAVIASLAAPARAASDLSPKQLMRFGVEAARQGLWREATARWERAVKDDGSNPRLHNNLAVAYESLGRFEEAEREYAEARKLAPDNREIHDNQESFLQMHAAPKPADAPAPAAPSAAPPSAAPPAGAPPAPGPPAVPPPSDHP
jgi:Tfp pilus assembly protein PilF